MKIIKWPSLRLYGLTLAGSIFACAAYEVIQEMIHLHGWEPSRGPHFPLPDFIYEGIHSLIGAVFGIIVSYPLAVVFAQWQNRTNGGGR